MSDLFSNLFGRRKQKHNDSRRSSSSGPTEENQQVNDCYLNGGETKTESDYEQLYTSNGNGWTLAGPNVEQTVNNTSPQTQRTTPTIPYISGIPFRTAGLAGEVDGLQDMDLLLLQFSSKLSEAQTLVSADYDFNLENQLMDEAIQAAGIPSSPPILQETEEEQMAKLMNFAQM